jgi:hypothetical protein
VLGDIPLSPRVVAAIEDAVVWARRIMDVIDRKFPVNHKDRLSTFSECAIGFTEDRELSS